jgi:hypothetical protein
MATNNSPIMIETLGHQVQEYLGNLYVTSHSQYSKFSMVEFASVFTNLLVRHKHCQAMQVRDWVCESFQILFQ